MLKGSKIELGSDELEQIARRAAMRATEEAIREAARDSEEVATYGENGRPQGNLTDLMTSKSTEYLTPSWILDLVEKVGPIDLDPCAHPMAEATKRALTKWIQPLFDGLKMVWNYFVRKIGVGGATQHGLAFVNPPYGRALKAWAEKMATAGCPVIALVPARTDTLWWKRMNPVAWCAVQGRLHFCGPDGKPIKDAAPFPSAVCLINPEGDQLARFVEAFKTAGIVYKRV